MPSERSSDKLLIQLGVGQVGAAVVSEAQRLAPVWRNRFTLGVRYFALADSSGFVVPHSPETMLTADTLASALQTHASGQPLVALPNSQPSTGWQDVLEQAILAAGGVDRVIVVDCAVGHGTTELLLAVQLSGSARAHTCRKLSM